MKLSIIMPAHNEERNIKEILARVRAVALPCEKEIIVVNDGSSDNTGALLQELSQKIDFKLFKHEKNLGKGTAIKTGLCESTGDLIVIQDTDLEYDPKDIPALLNAMNDDVAVVCGKRSSKRYPQRGYHYVLGAKIITSTINLLYGTKLSDAYTGYKVFNRNVVGDKLLKNIKSSGFEFEAEIICKILNAKGKIIEVPITYTPRSKTEGKHIGLKDAFKGFFTILKCKFNLDF